MNHTARALDAQCSGAAGLPNIKWARTVVCACECAAANRVCARRAGRTSDLKLTIDSDLAARLNHSGDASGADAQCCSIARHGESSIRLDVHHSESTVATEDNIVICFDDGRGGTSDAVANVDRSHAPTFTDEDLAILRARNTAAGAECSTIDVVSPGASRVNTDPRELESPGRVAGDDDASVLIERS